MGPWWLPWAVAVAAVALTVLLAYAWRWLKSMKGDRNGLGD